MNQLNNRNLKCDRGITELLSSSSSLTLRLFNGTHECGKSIHLFPSINGNRLPEMSFDDGRENPV